MCGIVGMYPGRNDSYIKNGVEILKHRGPDDDSHVLTSHGALGHTRLSIIDVKGGQQPMQVNGKWIVFNGEIYNFRKLSAYVSEPLATESDTEVLLHLYRQFGPGFVSLLEGMFSFAIFDGSSIFLARDPLGIKPLFFAVEGENIFFASEMKALIDLSTPIHEFPPGHWWHNEYGLKQFYQLCGQSLFDQRFSSYSEESIPPVIREKLASAVESRMIADSDVPIGVSLSGGLDSSIVAALAKKVNKRLNTFVVGISGSDDLIASQEAAKFLDTKHHVYRYSFSDMLEVLPEVIFFLESFDAPLVRSAIPNFFLAKLASDYVKVILTGEGADELYGGYDYLNGVENPIVLQKELLTITGGLHNTNLQRADRMSMAHGIEARVPFLDQDFVDFSIALPPEWKMRMDGREEKYLLRKAFAGWVPPSIVQRPKKKFSDGAGSMAMMADYAERKISDEEYAAHEDVVKQFSLRSKEELYYFQIFNELYQKSMDMFPVGRTRSITKDELN